MTRINFDKFFPGNRYSPKRKYAKYI